MGYHEEVFEPTKVQLTAKYYAWVSPLDKGENDQAQKIAQSQGSEATVKAGGAETRLQFDSQEWGTAVLVRGIREWNIDDKDGNVLPITEESVRGLRSLHAQQLLNAITAATNPLANADTHLK